MISGRLRNKRDKVTFKFFEFGTGFSISYIVCDLYVEKQNFFHDVLMFLFYQNIKIIYQKIWLTLWKSACFVKKSFERIKLQFW